MFLEKVVFKYWVEKWARVNHINGVKASLRMMKDRG